MEIMSARLEADICMMNVHIISNVLVEHVVSTIAHSKNTFLFAILHKVSFGDARASIMNDMR